MVETSLWSFFVLMVRSKLCRLKKHCPSPLASLARGWHLWCSLSANKKSLRTISLTFVTAYCPLGLNNFPSVLYLMPMSSSQSLKVLESMAESIMLKSVGVRTQPYFTPFITGKASEGSPLSRTQAIIPSWNWRTIAMNSIG